MEALATNMRAQDRVECEAVMGLSPYEALAETVRNADWAYAAEVDGEVVTIFGLTTHDAFGGRAAPWMLSAYGIEKHAREILVHARGFLSRMKGESETLANVVHADNASAIRFLTWCGFAFGDAVTLDGEPFRRFEMMN